MNVLQVIERVKGQESIVNSLEQDEKCIILMALEKMIPKKPIKFHTSQKRFYYACPICEDRQDRQEKHCYECGQALDWSEE